MKGICNFFDKKIVRGQGFLIFSVVFVALIRFFYLFHPHLLVADIGITQGWLWNILAPLFVNPIVSWFLGVLILGLLAFVVQFINAQFVLIRKKTTFPIATIILLFSCLPIHIGVSLLYVGVLTLLSIVYSLFRGYGAVIKQWTALNVGFHLSLGSLFAPFLLLYLPVIWVCLSKMRIFSFKALLASLFGVILVYVPTVTLFVVTGNIDDFIYPFALLGDIDWSNLPLKNYDPINYILLGLSLVLYFIILSNSYVHRHKDKVRVRAYLSVLLFVSSFSLICGLLVNLDSLLFLSIGLGTGSLLLAHFFALTESRVVVLLFFMSLFIYFAVSVLPLLFV